MNYILTILTCFGNTVFSQTVDHLLASTNTIYKENAALLNFPFQEKFFNPFSQLVLLKENASVIGNRIALKETEVKLYKNNLGLNFKVSANYNLQVVPDEETNINIRSSVRTELEWKILKNGFIANRKKALSTQNEIFQLKTQQNKADAELWRRQLKQQYTYAINEELKALLSQKEKFLNQYFDIVQQLYQQKYLGRNLIIDLGHQIHNNNQKLTSLKEHNKTLQDSDTLILKNVRFPLLQIRNSVNSHSKINSKISQDLALAKVELDAHWLENISFSVYANQNWITQLINNRNYTSVGLRFSAPIFNSYRKELIATKQAVIKAQFKDRESGEINRWIVQYSQYQEKVKDLNTQFKNWKLIEEQLRIAKVLKDELATDEFGIRNLSKQRVQFDILENVLEIKKQLYKAISDLNVIVPDLDYIPFKFKSAPNTTNLIITNATHHSYKLQLQFLKAKGFSEVIILDPTDELLKLCEEHQIKIKTEILEKSKRVDIWIEEELSSYKN